MTLLRMVARCTDPLTNWFNRSAISQGQFDAGRRFRQVFDAASLGGHAMIDLHLLPGAGLTRVPLPDAQVQARDELKVIRSRLGGFDYALLCRVVGQGQEIDNRKEEDRRYLNRRVRDALKLLGARVAVELV